MRAFIFTFSMTRGFTRCFCIAVIYKRAVTESIESLQKLILIKAPYSAKQAYACAGALFCIVAERGAFEVDFALCF